MHVHDQSSERKTGENIFKYIKMEIEHLRGLGVKVIGVVGDAGGDERKGWRLTLKEYPSMLAADCWGHQVRCRDTSDGPASIITNLHGRFLLSLQTTGKQIH
jgi:hypothetical protein